MMEKLRLAFARIGQFHNSRLVANISSHSKEENDLNLQANFDAGKRISDFVGMIVRFSFCQVATIYFLTKANDVEGIRSFIFALCFVSALGITVFLGVRIFSVILLYESRDVHHFGSWYGKTIIFLLAVLHTLILWYGLTALLNDLRKTIGS